MSLWRRNRLIFLLLFLSFFSCVEERRDCSDRKTSLTTAPSAVLVCARTFRWNLLFLWNIHQSRATIFYVNIYPPAVTKLSARKLSRSLRNDPPKFRGSPNAKWSNDGLANIAFFPSPFYYFFRDESLLCLFT